MVATGRYARDRSWWMWSASIQQRVLIVNYYYQIGESLVAEIREVRLIFGRIIFLNSLPIKRIIDKFETDV